MISFIKFAICMWLCIMMTRRELVINKLEKSGIDIQTIQKWAWPKYEYMWNNTKAIIAGISTKGLWLMRKCAIYPEFARDISRPLLLYRI